MGRCEQLSSEEDRSSLEGGQDSGGTRDRDTGAGLNADVGDLEVVGDQGEALGADSTEPNLGEI